MNVMQVYGIVNSVAAQMYGDKSVQVVDLNSLISLGNDVLSSDNTKDKFLNTLVDRIGKTIISQRAYSAPVKSLINDAFTFGAILQKIYIAPVAASESQQWNLVQGESVDQYVIAKPTVKQKLFSVRQTWEVDITIPDFQLSSAFRSAEEMAAFIDAIFLAIRNSMEVYLEGMAEMCYANMIGERVVNTKLSGGHLVINLLQDYNTLMGMHLSTAAAMVSMDFLKYASREINLYVKALGKMASIYNSEGYKRFTPPERLRVTMLADFTTACTSYLQANTYHDELVALPQYTEVMYWQGVGAAVRGFENTGTVNIRTASGYSLKQQYVICMLSDEEAIGLTYDNRRSKSVYNAKGEYTNYFEKTDIGYFNDLSENAIVFTVGTIATPTASTLATGFFTFSKTAPANVVETVTLAAGDAISAVNINGTAITADQGSEADNVVTINSAWLGGQATGTTVTVDVELATNAVLEFYITIGA